MKEISLKMLSDFQISCFWFDISQQSFHSTVLLLWKEDEGHLMVFLETWKLRGNSKHADFLQPHSQDLALQNQTQGRGCSHEACGHVYSNG